MKKQRWFVLLFVLAFGTGMALADEKAEEEKAKSEKDESAATLTEEEEEATPQGEAAPSETKFQGGIFVGGGGNAIDGSLQRVAEYTTVKDGQAAVKALVWGGSDKIRLDYYGDIRGDSQDMRHRFDLDAARYVKFRFDADRLPHRLDHDPLTNLDAGISTFIVRNTDYNPDDVYSIGRDFIDFKTEIVPNWEHIRFLLAYTHDARDGSKQAITGSKCANCHQVSVTREVDRRRRDLRAGAKLTFSGFTFDYQYLDRKFEENGATPINTYDQAVHPASLADVFGNRVQFDQDNGPLPFDLVPNNQKKSHIARAQFNVPKKVSVQGKFVASDVTNLNSMISADSKAYTGRVVVPFAGKAVLKADVRHMNIDSDSIFVEINEPVANAGPLAGKTYAEAYPSFGEASFLRESVRSRSPTDISVDFTYRPAKRTTLLVGYEYKRVNRDVFEVERTTSNGIEVGVRSRLKNGLRLRGRVKSAWIDDPFAYVHAAIPDVVQPGPSPGAVPFFGLQYFEMYDARLATLSSLPSRTNAVEGSATYSPTGKFSLTGHYRYKGASNNELNFSEWDRSVHTPGVEAWFAPSPKWSLAAGYNYQKEKTKTLFSILDFSG